VSQYGELAIEIENALRDAGRVRRTIPFDKAEGMRCRVRILAYIRQARNVQYDAAEQALTQESGWLGDMISRY